MMSYWLESTKDNRKEFDKLEKDINTDADCKMLQR